MIAAPVFAGLVWLLAGADPEIDAAKAPEAVAAATVAPEAKAEVALEAEVAESAGERTPATGDDRFLSFNFRHTPWKEVIPWFADEADLSLEMTSPPPGTCNYIDNRTYNLAEAIDVLNELLQIRGYTLIRRERLLMVVNLEDGIPPNLVPTITADELENRGKHEIVSVLFKLERLTPDQAEGELKKLVEPNGKVVVLPSAQQVMVTGSVWQLRTVREVVESIENPGSAESGPIAVFEMRYVSPLDALSMIRQLMDFPEDKNGTEDGSLRIAIDPLSGKLLASGRSDLVKRVRAILDTIDTPGQGGAIGGVPTIETPQLMVYGVGSADPNTVLSVLQTIFAGATDMNLALDPQNGSLIARAKPSQHATIRATIDELSGEAKQVEVFKLSKLDPQLAVLAINKLFASTGENAASAPKVDAEPNTKQLMVRGSKGQVEEIRKWLEKMGEVQTPGGLAKSNARMRMLPLTGRAQRVALEQLEQIWPTLRRNQIRVVTPSAVAPTLRGMNPAAEATAPQVRPNRMLSPPPVDLQPETPPTERTLRADEDRSSANSAQRSPFQLAVQQTPIEPAPAVEETTDKAIEEVIDEPQEETTPEATPDETDAVPADDTEVAPSKANAPIIVSPGPGGVMIASEDTEALDALEAMLGTLAEGAAGGSSQEFTVFYLQNASATTAAQTLASILGGSTGGDAGGSLMGDLAGAAFGDMGGLMGSLMGMGGGGGGGGGSGTVTRLTGGTLVVPDMRLNALFVQASQSNLDTIEQLLQVIDQPETPETQISPRPRIIQLYSTDATEVANIVKAVYQEQTSAGTGQRQPNPQEFMEMMLRGGGRGGRGGRGGGNGGGGGGGGGAASEVEKMTIGVDTRNNSLIVSAPQPLYLEVEQLVRTLDQAIPTSPETTRVVTLKRANTESVQEAISGLLGESAQTNSRSGNNNQRNNGRNQNQGNQNGGRQFGPGGFGGFGGGGFGGPGGGFGGFGGGGFGGQGQGQGGGQRNGGGGGQRNGGGGGGRGGR